MRSLKPDPQPSGKAEPVFLCLLYHPEVSMVFSRKYDIEIGINAFEIHEMGVFETRNSQTFRKGQNSFGLAVHPKAFKTSGLSPESIIKERVTDVNAQFEGHIDELAGVVKNRSMRLGFLNVISAHHCIETIGYSKVRAGGPLRDPSL
jgi:hypothetical protein